MPTIGCSSCAPAIWCSGYKRRGRLCSYRQHWPSYRFDLIILDDISYVRKDQAETSVLFELIAERYERRSLLITANQPFSGWDNVFPDPGMTVAAIDRLVHHSTIFELNVESYRRRKASDKQKERRRQLPNDDH